MTSRHPLRRAARASSIAIVLAAVVLAGCADTGASTRDGVQVRAAFYPLAYVAEQVGGSHVSVTNLTRPGAAAHDLTLSPRDVGALTEADLVVYLGDFQAAVDDALGDVSGHKLDVTEAARLEPLARVDHGHEDGTGHEGHDHGTSDPHFWLDPERLANVAVAVRDQLIAIDPDHRADYTANTDRFVQQMADLTHRYDTGLATCGTRDLVTTHAAFGYLAERFDLHQESITGLSPTEDPSGRQLATAAEFVKDHGVGTIFFETLVSPSVATAVADETGAKTAVLDPLEGLSEKSPGDDYVSVMDANLDALRSGLECR